MVYSIVTWCDYNRFIDNEHYGYICLATIQMNNNGCQFTERFKIVRNEFDVNVSGDINVKFLWASRISRVWIILPGDHPWQ